MSSLPAGVLETEAQGDALIRALNSIEEASTPILHILLARDEVALRAQAKLLCHNHFDPNSPK
jgi:hypothetical protein